VYYMLLTNI